MWFVQFKYAVIACSHAMSHTYHGTAVSMAVNAAPCSKRCAFRAYHRSASIRPESKQGFGMIPLSVDILRYHLFPLLELQDLLSLRKVCKSLQSLIDVEWYHRYFVDFPHDSRRLEGFGLERYARRSAAKLNIVNSKFSPARYGSGPPALACLRYFDKHSIVDFDFFELKCCTSIGFDGCDSFDLDEGIVIRSLDGEILIRTSSGGNARLQTTGLSGIHVHPSMGYNSELYGFQGNTLLCCDLRFIFYEKTDSDFYGEPEFLTRETDEITIHEWEANDYHELYAGGKILFEDLGGPTALEKDSRFATADPLLRARHSCHSLNLPGILTLFDVMKGPPRCLFLRGRIIFASSGKILYLVMYERLGQDGTVSWSNVLERELPNVITKIYGVDTGNTVVILLLDSSGDAYCSEVRHSPDHGNNTIKFPSEIHAHKIMENVADLVQTTILMKNGAVRKFEPFDKTWETVATANAVMITADLYLLVD